MILFFYSYVHVFYRCLHFKCLYCINDDSIINSHLAKKVLVTDSISGHKYNSVIVNLYGLQCATFSNKRCVSVSDNGLG